MIPEPKVEPKVILDLLIRNEETMSSLYKTYAARFGDASILWAELAVEEKSHAAQLRTLAMRLELDVSGTGLRFQQWEIEDVIRQVEEERSRVLHGDATFDGALRFALEMESSMVEKGFFEIFDGTDDVAQGILRGLRGLTENHYRRLAEFAAAHGFKIET